MQAPGGRRPKSGRKPLDPAGLSLPDASAELSRISGSTITEAMLRSDIAAGAPKNINGTLNLVLYTAWLVREMSRCGVD